MPNTAKSLLHRILPNTPPTKQQSDGTSTPKVLCAPPSSCVLQPEAGHQRLAQELVEMIFSYVHDTRTLRSCSLTCRMWYHAAKPHLHYSLKAIIPKPHFRYSLKAITTKSHFRYSLKTIITPKIHLPNTDPDWPNPLLEAHELRLLPFIKRFSIVYGLNGGFTHGNFGYGQSLCYFSALENLQELRMDGLQLSSFMPDIKKYFGHFPTLQSLALEKPEASCRQLLYFIGLFPYLQDLKLSCFDPIKEDKTTDTLALVPPSKPPLGGWLRIACLGKEFVDEMIALYGKLPFRRVDIADSSFWCAHRVFEGCVETLETQWSLPKLSHGCGLCSQWVVL
jgi:hypothetical protein